MKAQIIKAIQSAELYDIVKQTPVSPLNLISQNFKNNISLKREDLQDIHSFKLRGAHNKIKSLSQKELSKGIIAASAGNHAQGVAYSALTLNCKSTIVMPQTTPQIKVDSVKNYNAEIILHGDTYDEAYLYAKTIAAERDLVFIHPFDDELVIAGQGTIGKELLDQTNSPIDYLFIPVGGGGLIAGVASYIKENSPHTKIIAVEPDNSNCFHQSLQMNKRVILDQVGIFADGVAVKQIGQIPFELIKDVIDDTVLVSTDEICSSIKNIYDELRAVSEPAGALSLAGIKKYCQTHNIENKNIMGILCGANISFHRLRHISERTQIGEKKEALFGVTIPEEKGSFLQFCKALGKGSITEFNYRYTSKNSATIFAGIEIFNSEDKVSIFNKLNERYPVIDLSDNEVAKLHVRHMVGGRTSNISELFYRFEFPERPGALSEFLESIGSQWNITLFHYRNHGAAFGRVFAGFEVKKNDIKTFKDHLDRTKVRYVDENSNNVIKFFINTAE